MKMDTNIRVKTDERHRTLYNQLKNLAAGDMHELFFLCACLGFARDHRKPLGKHADDRFWSGTITPEEWCCFYSMVLERGKMDFARVQEDREVIACIEEYANGGMEILIEEFLADHLLPGDGEPTLDTAGTEELPKLLLASICDHAALHSESSSR